MFAEHYTEKAKKARQTGQMVFGVEAHIGTLLPEDGRQLYLARMDTHLTGGCEVCLNLRSVTAPLHSELNMLPIR